MTIFLLPALLCIWVIGYLSFWQIFASSFMLCILKIFSISSISLAWRFVKNVTCGKKKLWSPDMLFRTIPTSMDFRLTPLCRAILFLIMSGFLQVLTEGGRPNLFFTWAFSTNLTISWSSMTIQSRTKRWDVLLSVYHYEAMIKLWTQSLSFLKVNK